MSSKTDPQNRQVVAALHICNLLYDLNPSTYDEVLPKLEFWIEYVLDEGFTTTADLADRVSCVAWEDRGSHSDISRFLREFRDAPHRSEQARTFVDELCHFVLRWFSIASAEDVWTNWSEGLVSKRGGLGFIHSASFVGHLIELGLIRHELVRRYILKPLTVHYYNESNYRKQAVRANAIYNLFTTAGNTLLQGVLEPEEVQDCFTKLNTRVSIGEIGQMVQFDSKRLEEFRELHAKWLQCRKEQKDLTTTNNTLVAFALRNLPTVHSTLQSTEPSSPLRDVGFAPDAPIHPRVSTAPSPTLSVSTSELTPTELGEDIGEGSWEQELTRHKAFYLEDGNVEIVCGHTIFRIHTSIVSFSSSKLQEMLSPSMLLSAPMPAGCPRIFVEDSAEDFAVLLKMISTPGFPTWYKVPEFKVFASLLRMATRYGFSEVREQLIHGLETAYPTKWEAYQTASVLGEDVFGLPKPHPNVVLNLFLEQNVTFALPLATYRAALRGFPSLLNNEPGAKLSRLPLASAVHGMEVIRSEVSRFAYTVVCNMMVRECRGRCAVNSGDSSPSKKVKELNKIYDVVVKEGKGDVLSSVSLGDIVCENCAGGPQQTYRLLCETIWEKLPRIFGVGNSWEEL